MLEYQYLYHYCIFAFSPQAVKYVAQHSKGQIAVVEDNEQLQKFLKIKSDLKDLKGSKASSNHRYYFH